MSVIDQAATRNFLGVRFQIDHIDYDVNSNAIYAGVAPQGTADADAKWVIYQFVYDGSGRYTGSKCAGSGQVWNNRTSLTYT